MAFTLPLLFWVVSTSLWVCSPITTQVCSPYFTMRREHELFQSVGMPLGLFSHNTYEPAVLAFEPGARLLLVTKAVIESPGRGFEFGAERIERLLANLEADSASQICETVLEQAYAFGNRPGKGASMTCCNMGNISATTT